MTDATRVEVAPGDSGAPAGDVTPENLIGGEFKTQDELLAAYNELKGSVVKPVENKDDVGGKPKDEEALDKDGADGLGLDKDKPKDEVDTVEDALVKAGLDPAKYTQSFQTNGELSTDDYAELAKAGYSKVVVDTYVNGLKAQMESAKTATYAIVGTEADYRAMQVWANQTLTEEQRDAFNTSLADPTPANREKAVRDLHAQFVKANGKEANLVKGNAGNPGASADGFKTWAEAKTAMADKRYGKDRTYTQDVERRMASAKF